MRRLSGSVLWQFFATKACGLWEGFANESTAQVKLDLVGGDVSHSLDSSIKGFGFRV